jgi:hypothetical protein
MPPIVLKSAGNLIGRHYTMKALSILVFIAYIAGLTAYTSSRWLIRRRDSVKHSEIQHIKLSPHSKGKMLSASPSSATKNIANELYIFREVISTRKSSLGIVKEALITFESKAMSQTERQPWSAIFPSSKSSSIKRLEGLWELVFTTLVPTGYLPVYEVTNFFDFSVASSFKGISLGKVTGKSEIMEANDPVVMSLTSTGFKIGFIDVKFDPKKLKTKTYTFLYVDDELCVAKSSSGGYSILKRF